MNAWAPATLDKGLRGVSTWLGGTLRTLSLVTLANLAVGAEFTIETLLGETGLLASSR